MYHGEANFSFPLGDPYITTSLRLRMFPKAQVFLWSLSHMLLWTKIVLQHGGNEAESCFQQFVERAHVQAMDMKGQHIAPRKRFCWESQVAAGASDCTTDASYHFPTWRANTNCSILCPPKECGRCGIDIPALRHNFNANCVVKLIKNAEDLTSHC